MGRLDADSLMLRFIDKDQKTKLTETDIEEIIRLANVARLSVEQNSFDVFLKQMLTDRFN